jgi:hypothetical protein
MTRLLKILASTAIATAALTRMAGAQEVILQNYYESRGTLECSLPIIVCRANFPQNKSGRTVLVTDVNCLVRTNQPIRYMFLSLTNSQGSPGVPRYAYLEPVFALKLGDVSHYTVVNKVNFVVGAANKVPLVEVITTSSASTSLDCSISGTYTQ